MAVAVPALEPLTLTEVIETLWAEVAAGRAPSVSAALDRLWPIYLDEETAAHALRAGLIFLAHVSQTTARQEAKAPIAFGAPHGKRWAPYLRTLATPYEAADGQTRSLLDFTEADLAAFESTCANYADGWTKRGRVIKHLRALMKTNSVTVVRDLPSDVLGTIATEWSEAWA